MSGQLVMRSMTMWATVRVPRRIVGRIERGDSVIDAIQTEAKRHAVHDAWVRCSGTVDDAAIAPFDVDQREFAGTQLLEGASAMVHCHGRLAIVDGALRLSLYAVLARGAQLIAGQLVSARAGLLEVELDCWDDLPVADAPPSHGALAPVPAGPPVESPKTLGDAARALEAMPVRFESEDSAAEPEPGDLLDHPSFGVVEFEAEGEAGRVRIKLSTGSRREIMLEVFDVVPHEPIRGKRCFGLKPRRR